MGGGGSKEPTLRANELKELTRSTYFDEKEIQALFEHFKRISASIDNDGLIDESEFSQALGLTNKDFAHRLFIAFDSDKSGKISFKEFCIGMSVFCTKSSTEEKLKFTFKLYDIDGSGTIDENELAQLLKSAINGQLELSDEQISMLVKATISQVDKDGSGSISFQEYKTMVTEHPEILRSMELSSDQITALTTPKAKTATSKT